MNEKEKELFEERAAIIEYDGGYSKEEAEKLALKEILNDNTTRTS